MSGRLVFLAIATALALHAPITNAEELRGGVPEDNGMKAEGGRIVGPPAEAAPVTCIEQATGFTIHWQYYPTVRLLEMTERHELDLIYPMGFSEERDKGLARSDYVFRAEDNFLYLRQKPDFSDKAHIHVGAKRGSPPMTALLAQGFQNVEIVNSYDGLIRMLYAGRVEAILVPDKVMETFDEVLLKELRTEHFAQRPVGFYVGKTWPAEKMAVLNAAILKCRTD